MRTTTHRQAEPGMTTYVLKLMGPVGLAMRDDAGEATEVALSRTSQALLALLAFNAEGAAMPRETVAETLWPEAPPEKSRGRLNTALWRLRGAIGEAGGEGPLSDAGQRLSLAPPAVMQVDIHDLARRTRALPEAAVESWRPEDVVALEAAIGVRRGSFIDGVEGEWTYAARQSCAEIYEAALEALVRFHRHRGQIDRSIDAARRLVRQDPYREDIQAVLVELYARKGQRGRAIAHYASCRDLLKGELGIAPGAALRASLDRVLAPADAHGPDLLELVRTMDRTIDRLARNVDDIRAMLSQHRNE
jgi:DNA-binding SARP family transcriptional activator